MTARRGIIGLCMLCALAFSAMAAQGASAAVAGTTMFTCKMVTKAAGTAGFSKEHCKTADAVTTEATYEHVAIGEETPTTVEGSNGGTEGEAASKWTIKSTQAGINVELASTNVHFHGTMTNKMTAGGEHYIHGEGVLEITEVEVLPEKLKCKIKGGKLTTNELTFTGEGQGMKLKFQPKEGTSLLTYELEGCTEAELNGKYELTGSFVSNEVDGATVSFSHSSVTTQNTLKLRTRKTGIEGTLTLSGRDEAAGDTEYTPLSPTTVETPTPPSTTAFTCKMVTKAAGTEGFSKEHCKTADAVSTEATYEHVAFAEGTSTTVEGSDAGTEAESNSKWVIKSTQAGINLETVSTNVHFHGTMTNKRTASSEHYIYGESVIEITEVEVLPEKLKCKVKGGKLTTNALIFTGEGQGMKLNFVPKEGTALLTYEVEGCSEAELNGKYELTGSFVSEDIDGATVSFSHSAVTTQNTLKLRTKKVGIEGTLTLRGKDEAAGDSEYTPLSATTVETP